MSKVTAARGSSILTLAFLAVGLGNYAFTLALARLLAPDAFGVASLVTSFLLFASWMTASGLPWSAARQLSSLQDREEQAAVIRGALLGNMILALGVAGLLVALLGAGVLKLGDQPAAPIFLAAVACSSMGLNAAAKGGLQGILRLSTVAAANLVEVAVKLAVGVGLVWAGLGPTGAAAGILCGSVVATALTLVSLHRRHVLSWRGPAGWRLHRETVPMFLAMAGMALLTSLDLFAIKVLSPANGSNANVGFYQAAVTLGRVPYFFGSAVTTAVFPYIARSRADAEQATLYLRKALLFLLTLLVPIGLTALVAPESVVGFFFPARYLPAAGPLQVLSVGGVALAAAAVVSGALQAVGMARVAALATIAVVAAELLALPIAVRFALPLGREAMFVAAATVFDAVMVALVAILLAIGGRRFFRWRPRLRGPAGLVVSGAVFAGILAVLPHASRVELPAAVMAALLAYGACVVVLGVLSRGDLVTLRSGLFPLRKAAATA